MPAFPVRIEALRPEHDRAAFSCGVHALDQYLRRFARRHVRTNVSRTYVAAIDRQIHGFYSLSMAGIRKDDIASDQRLLFPNFPLSVVRLARMAVALPHQKQGLGELLLADALKRCLRLATEIGMIGVIVDAKDEHARRWYERYEFQSLPDSPLTLWLPAAAIERL